MNNNIKNKLAKLNNLTKEKRNDEIRQDIRQLMPVDDEIAILRKAVYNIYDIVSVIHPEMKENSEFREYYDLIEKIKLIHKEV